MSDHQEFSFMKALKDGQADAQAIRGFCSSNWNLVKLAFLLLSTVVLLSGMWGHLFTRCRIGWYRLLVLGLASLLVMSLIVPTFKEGPAFGALAVWMQLIFPAFLIQVGVMIWRRFIGRGREHIHSKSLGEPLPPIRWMSRFVLRGRELPDMAFGLLIEPALFAGIGAGVYLYERRIADTQQTAMTHAFTLFLLTSAGMLAQYLAIVVRSELGVSRLLDQQDEQTGLAEGLDRRPSPSRERSAEGFASVAQ